MSLDIVVDNSVIEVFANGIPVTHVYDPRADHESIKLFATGGRATFNALEVCLLKPAHIEIVENIAQ
ncbi:MAG: GH32 C-terminal domain-containing protein [Pseudomonadota bacterium]